MTQENNKDFLLKYLCMALPYGVKVWYKFYPDNITEKFATAIRLADGKIALSRKFNKEGDWYLVEDANELLIKPYLRPMSSMTDEERKEYEEFFSIGEISSGGSCYGQEYEYIDAKYEDITQVECLINWLLKNHFDFMDLIPKDLAIAVTENNNPYLN